MLWGQLIPVAGLQSRINYRQHHIHWLLLCSIAMAEPLSTPCPIDAPLTNNGIAHAITQEEDDVCLLNVLIALFSRGYEVNNGHITALTQSFAKDNIPEKRKATPRSPLPTAPFVMPSPRQKRQTQPVASPLLMLPFRSPYPLLPLRIMFTFLHQSMNVVLLYLPSTTVTKPSHSYVIQKDNLGITNL